MATDIAFAVGVLALLGDRIPSGLKVFLLSLAIVDDIGAILVIAAFYSSDLALGWLGLAGGLLLVVVLLRRARVLWVPVYAVVGTAVWFATFQSGVHATLAGVALGLLTPARPTDPGGFKDVVDRAASLPDEPDAEALRAVSLEGQEVVSVAERLEHLLHPWTSYVIIPMFALANAGPHPQCRLSWQCPHVACDPWDHRGSASGQGGRHLGYVLAGSPGGMGRASYRRLSPAHARRFRGSRHRLHRFAVHHGARVPGFRFGRWRQDGRSVGLDPGGGSRCCDPAEHFSWPRGSRGGARIRFERLAGA